MTVDNISIFKNTSEYSHSTKLRVSGHVANTTTCEGCINMSFENKDEMKLRTSFQDSLSYTKFLFSEWRFGPESSSIWSSQDM